MTGDPGLSNPPSFADPATQQCPFPVYDRLRLGQAREQVVRRSKAVVACLGHESIKQRLVVPQSLGQFRRGRRPRPGTIIPTPRTAKNQLRPLRLLHRAPRPPRRKAARA